jgi:membrane-associated protease RseP (regulator of RpoE activity)
MSQLTETMSPETVAATPAAGRADRPTARRWLLHGSLFLITAVTTTISGIVWLSSPEVNAASSSAPEAGGAGSFLLIPWYYLTGIASLIGQALSHPAVLLPGVKFSASLLAILTAHEFGHYFFCRHYGVDATLPFFIPQPPGLLPGTFGAFIKMRSPVPSRRALFDIGLAGPLAGFIVIIPLAFAGVHALHHANIPPGESAGLTFNDPLLFRLIAFIFKIDLASSVINSYYLAAWIGLLVTALNLMPVGQLDGGHATFSVFGQRAHWWIGRVSFVSMALLSVLGWLWHGSPSGFLYVLLLAVMLRVRHPPPENLEPLGRGRTMIGILTLGVFALCFLPFPITIG